MNGILISLVILLAVVVFLSVRGVRDRLPAGVRQYLPHTQSTAVFPEFGQVPNPAEIPLDGVIADLQHTDNRRDSIRQDLIERNKLILEALRASDVHAHRPPPLKEVNPTPEYWADRPPGEQFRDPPKDRV